MNKNDVITLKIEDMSHEGAGIGHVDGMTVFVKDAVMGDTVEAVVTKAKKNMCFAAVKNILEASPFRVEPKCPEAKRCGGCQMQQLEYQRQVQLKGDIVKNNLIRLGGFDAELISSIMEPTVGMDEPFRYRNKAQVPVGEDKDGNIVMGYYGARSHRIVSLPDMDCMLSDRINKAILEAVKSYMMDGNIPAYDEESGKGLIRHVLIREGKATGEIMVCLVINGAKLPNQAALVEALSGIESVTSICVNCNTRRDNVILGEKTYAIFGEDYITDSITLTDGEGHVLEPISFQISANSFYQVNHDQMEKLYSIAIDYADLSGNESVWDLYCGIGTISLSMARKAGTVYGVEIVPQAIENAKNNASLNGITNAQFFVGKAEEVLPDFYQGHP